MHKRTVIQNFVTQFGIVKLSFFPKNLNFLTLQNKISLLATICGFETKNEKVIVSCPEIGLHKVYNKISLLKRKHARASNMKDFLTKQGVHHH